MLQHLLCGGLARQQVWLPGCYRHGILIGRVTSPQRLDEYSRRTLAPCQVLLPLLLLYLQSEARAQNSLPENQNLQQ